MEEKQFSDLINSRLKGFTSYCGLEFTQIADEKCVISCRLRPELLNRITGAVISSRRTAISTICAPVSENCSAPNPV